MTIMDTFLGFLFAFIVKDFYDIFIQERIKEYFQRQKKLVRKMGYRGGDDER